MRRALKDLVPGVVLQRRTKAGPDEAFMRALIRQRRWVTALLREPRVAEHGFVDRAALHAAVSRAMCGESADQVTLARTLSLELWLRTLEEAYSTSVVTAPPGWRTHQPHQQGESHEAARQ
jgi:hypothetical protein